jgi:uncharacterized protein (TIGR03083 family)
MTVRDRVERSWRAFIGRLHDHPDRWAAPTRLTGWTVADLAAHACWGTSLEADALERALSGAGGPAEGRSPEPAAPGESVLAELQQSCDRLMAALDALDGRVTSDPASAPATLPMPYGEVPVELGTAIFVMEAGVHGSDLAAAMGVDDTLDADVCRATFAVLAVFAPILAAAAGSVPPAGAVIEIGAEGEVLRLGSDDTGQWTSSPTGSATTVITGGLSDVTLFMLGRRPVDAVTVQGDQALAGQFKTLVPGP